MRMMFAIATIGRGRALTLALTLALVPAAALAGDAEGRFAAKGAGQTTCQQFLTSMEEKGDDLRLYAGWVDGYVTAFNMLRDETFDIAPWQSTELLVLKLQAFCRANPESPFMDGMNQLALALYPDRLTEPSEIVSVQVGAQRGLLYRAVLDRVEAKLRDLGHLAESPEGDPAVASVEAIRAFQTAQGVPVTGLPDQATLNALFP
jgi:hypothetical protein